MESNGTRLESDHERTDISLKAVVVFLIIMVLGIAAVHVSLFWWLNDLNRSSTPDAAAQWRADAQFLAQPGRGVPRLQISPQTDWELYATQQQQKLNTYGWINQTGGFVRIPIQEAMERIATNGVKRWGSNKTASPLPLQHWKARGTP